MAKILSISVPGKLYERLQIHKDKLNVSQLCQNAIEAAIRLEEAKNMEGDEMEKLVARIRAEKSELDGISLAAGKKDGIEATKGFSYTDFLVVQSIKKSIEHGQGCDIGKALIDKEVVDKFYVQESEDMYASSAYWAGWIEGILEVWGKVEKLLGNNTPEEKSEKEMTPEE